MLDAIIRKTSVLSTPVGLQTNEAMHSDDEEDSVHSNMHSMKNGAFVNIVLATAKEVVQRYVKSRRFNHTRQSMLTCTII